MAENTGYVHLYMYTWGTCMGYMYGVMYGVHVWGHVWGTCMGTCMGYMYGVHVWGT